MKAVVFTLGCKVNECESDSIITGLKKKGYEVSDKLEKADLYIINTCAVTKEAEKKSRQALARARKLNPQAKVIFTGCAAQKNPQDFAGKKGVSLVTGCFNKQNICDMTDDNGVKISPEPKDYEELETVSVLRTRAFIKVQDGCDNFCTYCTVPYLRGRSRSRKIESVIYEIEKIKPVEAVINGINLSSYNYNGKTLTDLMLALKNIDARIRLGSLEVNVITKEFLEAVKNLKDFAPHFHLSLQSGSNETLKKMNRRYTAEEFLEKVSLIRTYFPDAGITTDVIAGFPTETEENFAETISLIKKAEFSDIHPFVFSPREGTVAYKMKDLDPSVKKERLARLMEMKRLCTKSFALKMQGKTLSCLFEEEKDGFITGYTENYLRIYLKKENAEGLAGKIVKVKVLEEYLDGACAELV